MLEYSLLPLFGRQRSDPLRFQFAEDGMRESPAQHAVAGLYVDSNGDALSHQHRDQSSRVGKTEAQRTVAHKTGLPSRSHRELDLVRFNGEV